ncbi:uncharacterized protein (TIGR00730 family) [Paenibacillus shirakamiensis]|uniref:Cytokinin riboside 5'-monophosphate phosphoribohydrolase n=1 Tax=Paenibacillus shirakamiensis TaxID=1265935 RepID=A0ABS4JC74_9BACL|nr:TIGR00730 family Rossman fold protein [Paenibacillus shirakamiensis]MBP1999275.1 uncharacterized protein (TIGR00730 family) [Paenibacillus shirakamiensis]
MQAVCVFAGSAPGNNPEYTHQAIQLGNVLAKSKVRLIYGGSRLGLMGEIANEVLSLNGSVTGIMPRGLLRGENVHQELTAFVEVESMHERKAMMNEMADGFIALPGGLGTLEELFEVLCWSQIGIHQKPIGLLNVNGYYDPLIELIKHSVEQGFAHSSSENLLIVANDAHTLFQMMSAYQPERPEAKWKHHPTGKLDG